MLRWLPVIALAGACGSSKRDEPAQQASPTSLDLPAEEPTDAGPLDLAPAGPPKPPDPAAPSAPVTIAGQCLQASPHMTVRLVGDDLRACVDSDQDEVIDRCAHWFRSNGAWRGFEAAADDDQEVANPPIAFGDNADDRLAQSDDQLEVCPPDRICQKLMPKLPDEDGEITGYAADAAYRTLAVAMRAGTTSSGYVELWDLVAGRVRSKVKLRKLEADVEYTFDVRYAGGAILAIATRSHDGHAQGVIAGPDGSVRGELANGTRYLHAQSMYEIAPGMLALLDLEAPGVPYAVYTQSLATGRTLKKLVVQMDMDGDDDDTDLHHVGPRLLAVTQWSSELRLDLIDLATGRQTSYRVPAC